MHGLAAMGGGGLHDARLDRIESGVALGVVELLVERDVAGIHGGEHMGDGRQVLLMPGQGVVDPRRLGRAGQRARPHQRGRHRGRGRVVALAHFGPGLEPVFPLERFLGADLIPRLLEGIVHQDGMADGRTGAVGGQGAPEREAGQREEHRHQPEGGEQAQARSDAAGSAGEWSRNGHGLISPNGRIIRDIA